LSQQLEREIAQSATNGFSTNLLASAGGSMQRRNGAAGRQPQPAPSASGEPADSQNGDNSQEASAQQSGAEGKEGEQTSNQQPGSRGKPGRNGSATAQSQEANPEGKN